MKDMDTSIKFLSELISLCPVTADYDAVDKATDLMYHFLDMNNVHCCVEKINNRKVLWAATVDGKEVDYLLNVHLDVVAPSADNQHIPALKDGFIYGRGAADCLGNAVCAALLLQYLNRKASVGCIFTVDEEVGGHSTAAMVNCGYCAKKSVIVLDGGYGMVSCSQKGMMVLKLTASGNGGHSSDPWNYVNPIETLLTAFSKVREKWKNPTHTAYWGDSMTPCMIKGGFTDNVIPRTAEMSVNIRYINSGDENRIYQVFSDLPGITVELERSSQPLVGDQNNPEIRFFADCLRSELNDTEVCIKPMCGATDARHLQKLAVPVIITGLNGYNAHSKNECLKLNSMDNCFHAIVKYVKGIS